MWMLLVCRGFFPRLGACHRNARGLSPTVGILPPLTRFMWMLHVYRGLRARRWRPLHPRLGSRHRYAIHVDVTRLPWGLPTVGILPPLTRFMWMLHGFRGLRARLWRPLHPRLGSRHRYAIHVGFHPRLRYLHRYARGLKPMVGILPPLTRFL